MDDHTFGLPIMLGADQFISRMSPSGMRAGLLVGEGFDLVIHGGDGGPLPAIDLRVQFALWNRNDFFLSVGAQFLIGLVNTGSGPMPAVGLVFQTGGLQYQM